MTLRLPVLCLCPMKSGMASARQDEYEGSGDEDVSRPQWTVHPRGPIAVLARLPSVVTTGSGAP